MKAAVLASLTVLSLNLPALSATPQQYQYQFKGQNVNASFSQYDNCSFTSVSVYAFENVTKDAPGAPVEQEQAYVYYSNYNYCTGTGFNGYGYSQNLTFTGTNLNTAKLKGIFTINDGTGNTKNMDVDLTWTGTGYTYRGTSSFHSTAPGYISRYRSTGGYSEAEVSGSVFLDGTNLIPNLSGYGSINLSNSGSLYIIKN